jgi:hypothetical protein
MLASTTKVLPVVFFKSFPGKAFIDTWQSLFVAASTDFSHFPGSIFRIFPGGTTGPTLFGGFAR